jgi:hypothetical protein
MENRYWLWLFIIGLTVGLGCLFGFFLAQQYYEDLEKRLDTLEKQYVTSLKPGQEVKMDELKVYVDKEVIKIQSQYDLVMKLGLPATIAALLASIFGAYRWAAEIAKQKAEAAFKDRETILKEHKRIVVLTPEGNAEAEIWIRKFFTSLEFRQTFFKKTTEIESLKNEQFDLILINADGDSIKQDDLTKLLKDIVDVLGARPVFYFGKGKAENSDLDKDGRLSYANAKSQLYGNLINALKFQAML